jgi:hypothetical protein
MAEAYWYAVPPPVDLYLQVAGLGPKQDAEFVRSLQSKGFHAQIQNPDNDNARVLIGPFSTHAEMEQKQRKLQSGGILAVETAVGAGNWRLHAVDHRGWVEGIMAILVSSTWRSGMPAFRRALRHAM